MGLVYDIMPANGCTDIQSLPWGGTYDKPCWLAEACELLLVPDAILMEENGCNDVLAGRLARVGSKSKEELAKSLAQAAASGTIPAKAPGRAHPANGPPGRLVHVGY